MNSFVQFVLICHIYYISVSKSSIFLHYSSAITAAFIILRT